MAKMLHDDFEAWIRDRARGCMEQEEIDELCKADLDLDSHEYTFRDDSMQAQWEAWQAAKASGENQITVSTWANETFGPSGSNARVAARANEEMAELLRALTADDNHPKAAEEVADIVIILYRLATRLGIDLYDEIDRKMEVNRKREWKLDKTGHGYHVRENS